MRINTIKSPHGVHVLRDSAGVVGPDGVLSTMGIDLPDTKAICHYAAFQRHDPMRQARTDQSIGGGANRVQGLRISRWSETLDGGLFAVTRCSEDYKVNDAGWSACNI